MNIEGTYTLQASLEEVWRCLTDRELLLRTVPGLTRVERIDGETYAISLHIKYAPLIGTYDGHVKVTEQHEPYYCHITITGEQRQNVVGGSGSIHMNERNGNTIIHYSGTLAIGRPGALLPPRIVTGATKLFIQQFLNGLASSLREPGTVYVGGRREGQDGPGDNGIIDEVTIFTGEVQRRYTPTTSFILRCARLVGLGNGDPEEEVRWALRIRRMGIIAVLLFLVWVGTRLPRR